MQEQRLEVFDVERLRPLARQLMDDVDEWALRTVSPVFVIDENKTREAIRRAKDKLVMMGF